VGRAEADIARLGLLASFAATTTCAAAFLARAVGEVVDVLDVDVFSIERQVARLAGKGKGKAAGAVAAAAGKGAGAMASPSESTSASASPSRARSRAGASVVAPQPASAARRRGHSLSGAGKRA
jgi:hypothetical protein